jgi:membrane protein YdbS with pleckstrin-like domain
MGKTAKNVYKTSRRAYFWNYFLAGMVVIFLYLLITTFSLTFSFIPKTFTELWNSMVILLVIAVAGLLSEEPILIGLKRQYVIGEDEITQIDGILRKKKFVLPYQGIADVRVNKGILGRILNYGDVEVVGFKESIDMKGMAYPDEIHGILQSKLSRQRGGLMSRRKHDNGSDKDYVRLEDR